MKKICFLALAAIVLAFMIVGCDIEGKDIDAIQELVLADEVWFDANTEVDSTGGGSMFFGDTASGVIWWRTAQTHDEPVIDVQVDGDSGWVEWSRGNFGSVTIWAFVPDSNKWFFWEKELSETAKVRAVFRKTGSDADPNRGWELEKISCAVGASTGGDLNIDKIHITSAETGYDFEITDPLDTYYDIDEDMVTFKAGEEVTVTLYVNDTNTVAFIHSFTLLGYVRGPFPENEGGVHSGTWEVQRIPFPRWVIFDVMTKPTLYDSEGEYEFSGILFPYYITP
ncbi:hypothetical protein CEE36_11255 [candidate division TA06 bacterium B3_TA06]|uniref:Uncharacterized protein n=1 Tax=candidate division TA06 bacterium B3_TA06 TaxID=2012487 RepID=A0A532UQY8_UNCT6|nr:MAG: hypothetical protein CEE36_11255 [candidate division TA06 bacterium B3_TA06]